MPASTGKISTLRGAGYDAQALLVYSKRGLDGMAVIDLGKREWGFYWFAPDYRRGDLLHHGSWEWGAFTAETPIQTIINRMDTMLGGADPGIPTEEIVAEWLRYKGEEAHK